MNKLMITKEAGVATVLITNPPVNILTIDLINELNSFILSLKDANNGTDTNISLRFDY